MIEAPEPAKEPTNKPAAPKTLVVPSSTTPNTSVSKSPPITFFKALDWQTPDAAGFKVPAGILNSFGETNF